MENPTLERIVGSTFISNNIHKVINDNNNCYRNMVMYAIRINHGYLGECLYIDEESNVDTNKFFISFKIMMNYYRICT
jgi:hypothetical protein